MISIPLKRTIDRLPGGMMIVPSREAAASATVLVASSVVVTAVLTPIITAWWGRWATRSARNPDEAIAVHTGES